MGNRNKQQSVVKPWQVNLARHESIITLINYLIILTLCVFLHSTLQRLRNNLNINYVFSY